MPAEYTCPGCLAELQRRSSRLFDCESCGEHLVLKPKQEPTAENLAAAAERAEKAARRAVARAVLADG